MLKEATGRSSQALTFGLAMVSPPFLSLSEITSCSHLPRRQKSGQGVFSGGLLLLLIALPVTSSKWADSGRDSMMALLFHGNG